MKNFNKNLHTLSKVVDDALMGALEYTEGTKYVNAREALPSADTRKLSELTDSLGIEEVLLVTQTTLENEGYTNLSFMREVQPSPDITLKEVHNQITAHLFVAFHGKNTVFNAVTLTSLNVGGEARVVDASVNRTMLDLPQLLVFLALSNLYDGTNEDSTFTLTVS